MSLELEDVVGSRVVGPERPRDRAFDVHMAREPLVFVLLGGAPTCQCTVEHHIRSQFPMITNTACFFAVNNNHLLH